MAISKLKLFFSILLFIIIGYLSHSIQVSATDLSLFYSFFTALFSLFSAIEFRSSFPIIKTKSTFFMLLLTGISSTAFLVLLTSPLYYLFSALPLYLNFQIYKHKPFTLNLWILTIHLFLSFFLLLPFFGPDFLIKTPPNTLGLMLILVILFATANVLFLSGINSISNRFKI